MALRGCCCGSSGSKRSPTIAGGRCRSMPGAPCSIRCSASPSRSCGTWRPPWSPTGAPPRSSRRRPDSGWASTGACCGGWGRTAEAEQELRAAGGAPRGRGASLLLAAAGHAAAAAARRRRRGARRPPPRRAPTGPARSWTSPASGARTSTPIPGDCPYLPARTRQPPLLPPARQFRVGIVWAGRPTNDLDRRRSCGLDHFAPLVELPGTEFVSFQVGPRAAELRTSGWYGLIREAPPGPGTCATHSVNAAVNSASSCFRSRSINAPSNSGARN